MVSVVRRSVYLLRLLIALLISLLFCSTVQGASYRKVTSFTEAVFRNIERGVYERVVSELITANIFGKTDFDITTVLPTEVFLGQQINFSHKITNIGQLPLNLVGTIWFEYEGNPDYFSLNDFAIVLDRNNDGKYSIGDEIIPLKNNGSGRWSFVIPQQIQVNGFISILLSGVVPNLRQYGDKSIVNLQLSATDEQSDSLFRANLEQQVTDEMIVKGIGELKVFAKGRRHKIPPNSDVNLKLLTLHSGGVASEPTHINIDGILENKIYVDVNIPTETVFNGVGAVSENTEVLYHLSESQGYTRRLPEQFSSIESVAFAWNDFEVGSAQEMNVQLVSFVPEENSLTLQASAYQSIDNKEVVTQSNMVTFQVVGVGDIAFMSDRGFSQPVNILPLGKSIYLKVTSPLCSSSSVSQNRRVKLTSEKSRDIESNIIIDETGVGTGIFTAIIPTNILSDSTVLQENGVLTLAAGDRVTAEFSCNGASYSKSIDVTDSVISAVSIVGSVFQSNEVAITVPHATVELYSIHAPADLILESDGNFILLNQHADTLLSPDNQVLVANTKTDELGRFVLDNIPLSNLLNQSYVIRVINKDYIYPTKYSYQNYRFLNKKTIPIASYGGYFSLADGVSQFSIDIPIDYAPDVSNSLFIEKTVDKEIVEYGQVLTYTVDLLNKSTQPFTKLALHDYLPRGFMYVPDSARLDGMLLEKEVTGVNTNHLVFNIDKLSSDATRKLTYQVRVRVTAPVGKASNLAQLIAPKGIISNTSSATVLVKSGVFSDEAFIVGTIYTDCNGNGIKDSEELGIPFVRMYLEDGTFVISDGDGKYSLYGLKSGTRVMKVDSSTLPKGAQLVALNNRFANDASSQFVDLKKGELHRADFAVKGCSAELNTEIKTRQEKWANSSFSQLKMPTIGSDGLSVEHNRVVMGKDEQGLSLPGTEKVGSYLLTPEPQNITDLNVTHENSEQAQDIETVIRELDNKLDFVGIADGELLNNIHRTIRVKGPLGAILELKVAGKVIPIEQIGQNSRLESRNIQLLDYVGVPFAPGENEIELNLRDDFGNLRNTKSLKVFLPGEVANIIVTPVGDGVADGVTPLAIKLELLDKDGNKVIERHRVNLTSEHGHWISVGSENPDTGFDVLVDRGERIVELVSYEAGIFNIGVNVKDYREEKIVQFLPDLRPLIAVGVVEGITGFNGINKEYIQDITQFDNFESVIKTSFGKQEQAGAVGLRGALFLKGKIKGNYLLTLRYDSDSKTKEEMFDNIDPNKFYPIYGDDSIKGTETNSLSPLFIRIEKGHSYILYGDYGTTNDSDVQRSSLVKATKLGEYQRNLTGIQGRLYGDNVKLNYFVAKTNNNQHILTFRGEGISGPYDVNMGIFIRNSEKVKIITRSQVQPAIIIDSVTLTRFQDYIFDAFYNTIIFTRPIPSVDINGNPIEIEITYEREDSVKQHWVYGASGSVKISPYISVGATFAEDKDPKKSYRLYSVNTIFQIIPTVALAVELARSESHPEEIITEIQKGQAYRLELVTRSKNSQFLGKIYVYRADKLFNNTAAGITPSKLDSGLTVSYKVNDSFVVHAEGIYSKDLSTKDIRIESLAAVEHTLTESLSGRVGIRYVQDKNSNEASENATSAFLRFMWKPNMLPSLLAYIEGEQVLNARDKYSLAAGAEYLLTQKFAIYGRHQFISKLDSRSSLNGSYGLSSNLESANKNLSTIGIKYNYATGGSVFSEYRITDIIDGKQAEGAIGISQGVKIFEGLELSTSFERVQPFLKNKATSTAATLGLSYTANPNWKGTARLEWRGSKERTHWLNTLGIVRKINKDWSLLFSNILAYEVSKNSNKQVRRRNDGRVGVAYRDTQNNRLSLLVRYQMLLDNNEETIKKELSHVVSAHANYQLSPKMVASGRYAFGYSKFNDLQSSSHLNSHLLVGRVTYDLTDRFDIGITASRLFSSDSAQRKSYGVEIGYLAGKNIWFSIGYNLVGYRDRLLSGSDYTQHGLYLRMRVKFDEDLFRWLVD